MHTFFDQNIDNNSNFIDEGHGLDNIRNIYRRNSKVPEKEDFLSKLKRSKNKANMISLALVNFANKSGEDENDIFNKTARKIKNCSTYGAFREVVPGQIHKIGQALCKNKFCPVCQKHLSWKRRDKAMTFFEENKEVLKDYNCYHVVLTLRHTKFHRNYDYVGELLDKFYNLRGSKSNKKSLKKWKVYIKGGYYSVEIIWGKDSPHIHLHIMAMTKKSVKIDDLGFIKDNWKELTGDSDQVLVEPVFFLQDEYEEGAKEFIKKDGSTAWKIEYDSEKHDISYLQRAFMESLKYTIKADDIFNSIGDDIDESKIKLMRSLLIRNHNLYNRFGCLRNTKSNRDIFKGLEKLAINFKDLEDVNIIDKSLVDVETGEEKDIGETNIFVTRFSNVKVKKQTDNYTLYKFINYDKISHFHGDDMTGVQTKLSRTIKRE